jgi:hypothetical protein
MNAVWSFWTKPYLEEHRLDWRHELHHWLAWGLSVYAARQHYPHTRLVTDEEGARILVDELQLPFESVSTALDAIGGENPNWWALGKIEAYHLQKKAFIHIDADVFLWKRLAPELETADLIAQNPEGIDLERGCYCPKEFERSIGWPANGWLPQEWTWYRQSAISPQAQCCGIFGGGQIDFINHFAQTALRIVRHPRNRAGWRQLPGKHMLLIEQYLLSAMIQYHRRRKKSRLRTTGISYVFPTIEDAFVPERVTEVGFTHLASGAKRNPRVARDLERRVARDLPEHYERCARYVRTSARFRRDYHVEFKQPGCDSINRRDRNNDDTAGASAGRSERSEIRKGKDYPKLRFGSG